MEFLEELFRGMEPGERAILCAFRGDPNAVDSRAWAPKPWRSGDRVVARPSSNAYTTLSTFKKYEDGSWRRRTDAWSGGFALMVDDVYTKVDESLVKHMEPTVRIETSPGNEQWWYFLRTPCRDKARFDQMIRAFIHGQLLGNDPGMSGVNRVGRLPGFTNGKEKYDGYITREVGDTDYTRRYSITELIRGFRLDMQIGLRKFNAPKTPRAVLRDRIQHFERLLEYAHENNVIKGENVDPSGWLDVHCPWMDEHTNAADTGAAIRMPDAENDFYGAFRCHHGHCAERGWSDYSEYLVDAIAADAASSSAIDLYEKQLKKIKKKVKQ